MHKLFMITYGRWIKEEMEEKAYERMTGLKIR